MYLNLKNVKVETNYGIKVSNDSMVDCRITNKLIPITIGGVTFPRDMIQFHLLDFDIILGMN